MGPLSSPVKSLRAAARRWERDTRSLLLASPPGGQHPKQSRFSQPLCPTGRATSREDRGRRRTLNCGPCMAPRSMLTSLPVNRTLPLTPGRWVTFATRSSQVPEGTALACRPEPAGISAPTRPGQRVCPALSSPESQRPPPPRRTQGHTLTHAEHTCAPSPALFTMPLFPI